MARTEEEEAAGRTGWGTCDDSNDRDTDDTADEENVGTDVDGADTATAEADDTADDAIDDDAAANATRLRVRVHEATGEGSCSGGGCDCWDNDDDAGADDDEDWGCLKGGVDERGGEAGSRLGTNGRVGETDDDERPVNTMRCLRDERRR